MQSFDILLTIYSAGVTLTPIGDEIEASGPLTDDLLAFLRDNKPSILDELRWQRVGEADGFPSDIARTRFATPPTCIAEGVCRRLGPCEGAATINRCDATTTYHEDQNQ